MNTQPHILLVEDDRQISELLARFLRSNGCRVSMARDAREMDRLIAASRLDLLVLDIMLPGEDGLSICRRIRANTTLPIIMASAKGEEVDRVIGLEVGADDYISKPFGARELLARIRAVLRRAGGGQATISPSGSFRFAGFLLDTASRQLQSPTGALVALTGAEFDLLAVLCERPRIVLSRDQLLDLTQGRVAGPFERSIDILVSRLRRKLGPGAGEVDLIRTVRAEGYVFTPDVAT